MTILVTGATGLVGNNVVRHVLSAEPDIVVRCLVRPGYDVRALAGLNVEIAEGDVTDPDSVAVAMKTISAVVHAAAAVRIGWSDAATIFSINVDGTGNIARAAREAGARMLHVSSMDTRRGSQFADIPYVASKKAAEDVVRAEVDYGLDAVIARPAFLLGPHDWKPSSGRVLLTAARRWVPFAPRGCVSICDARDVAAAMFVALRTAPAGREFDLVGYETSWLEALGRFARTGGAWPPICRFDPITHRVVGYAGDLAGRVTGREPSVNSATMRLAGHCMSSESGLAERELGYSNRAIEQTLNDTRQWFSNHGFPR